MNYSLRGKCKEMAEEASKNDPSLTLVRGWYDCPIWGEQPHWWCVDQDGKIVDPSRDQFPSGGIEEFYRPFNGTVICSQCGKEMAEEHAKFHGNYAFCSYKCEGKFIGVL
jgi:hypothetical protein